MVEGGPWCNENQANCEGSCSGKWCTNGGPNPTTPTWSPVTNPTGSPTNSPSWQPTMDISEEPTQSPTVAATSCSDDPDEEFFFKMKNGEPLFKTCDWLSTRTDSKRNNVCTKKTDSYNGIGPAKEVCKVECGTCSTNQPSTFPSSAAPTLQKSPTVAPSTSTETPTFAPTHVPTHAPTHAPTKFPTTSSDACCSNDYKNCMNSPWCDESSTNCQQCGGILITGAPLQCVAKWAECTNDTDGCCAPSTCQGNGGSYMQCL